MDEVMLNKVASLEKCLYRIREEYQACQGNIKQDILRQDSIILNLERACEQCIDMGQRLLRQKKLGLPKQYREVFSLLAEAKIISPELSEQLQRMVGFRNIAIHEYQELDIDRVKHIVEHGLNDLSQFAGIMLKLQT